MNSVQLSIDSKDKIVQQAQAAEDSYCYPEIDLLDQAETRADRIQLQYEDLASVFVREMLTTLYGLAAARVFTLPSPRTVVVERGGNSFRHNTTYPPLAKPSQDTVVIAITEDDVRTDEHGRPAWEPSHLSATVEVNVEHFVSSIVAAADEYVSLVRKCWPDEWRDERLVTLLDDGRSIRNYVEKHGSATGFELNPDSDRVQQYLYHAEYEESALSRFLVETGTLREIVGQLRERDGQDVETKYEMLLSHQSDIIKRGVLQSLKKYPDDRAKQQLINQRWADDPEIVPLALGAAAQSGGADVRDALLDTLEFSNEPRIRETAVNELATYIDDDVADTLAIIAEEDDTERVRAAARRVLSEHGR
ncbi:HEAT repeat domain-containing protein [Natronoarchaeum rubrum]|uniref:HEAT repeat domain-containing protein n=1 Tax=Natronoarchaeum rubrum TaxID=755311 RepID=UPI0021121B55|nr:HEAT repeat domain-containing protein [Natronoarchaeum rubrum]